MSNLARFRRFITVCSVTALIAVGGCTPRVVVSGNSPDQEDLNELVVGETFKDEVAELLGTPSAIPVFDSSVWLYISRKTQAVAFFEPEVLEQKVVLIRFDEGERILSMAKYDLADGRDIEFAARTTPTAGKDLTILQQMFGNLGRFTADK